MIVMGLAILSWEAVPALVLACCVVYGYPIHVEEKALAEMFGEEYIEYPKETKMLVPGVV